jgi:hypothetical protein
MNCYVIRERPNISSHRTAYGGRWIQALGRKVTTSIRTMDVKDWITIAVAAATLVSGWAQFWVKERLFNPDIPAGDAALTAVRSKSGISFLAFTALISIAAGWLLLNEVHSKEPLTRTACFFIASLTVLTLLNVVLVHSLFVLRRLAALKVKVEQANKNAQSAVALHWFG